MSASSMVLVGWLVMSLLMSGLWLIQRRTNDAGIVDVAWGLGVGGLSLFYALYGQGGVWERRILIAGLAVCWAVRLSAYITYRLLTLPEDGRYTQLKADWGSLAQSRLFWFFQFQAFGSVLFSLPMLIGMQSTSELHWMDWVGVVIWLGSILGESLADWQLARFRADPANQGQVCRRGLWNYSRHPNYFFEWLHWWSYVCLAVSAPWGWLTVIGPISMLYFILRVTGIPPTEAQALKRRGEAYREYQRTTSALFPWFPRKSMRDTLHQS